MATRGYLSIALLLCCSCATPKLTQGPHAIAIIDAQTLRHKEVVIDVVASVQVMFPDPTGQAFRAMHYEDRAPHILVFSKDGELLEERVIPNMELEYSGRYYLSPEGGKLLYTNRMRRGMFAVDTKTGQQHALTEVGDIYYPSYVEIEWVSDDLAIVALCVNGMDRLRPWHSKENTIFVLNLTGFNPKTEFLLHRPAIKEVALSPDKKQLAIIEILDESPFREAIILFNIDSKAVTPMWSNEGGLKYVRDLAWSPSGQQLAFAADRDILVSNIRTGEMKFVQQLKSGMDVGQILMPREDALFYTVYRDEEGFFPRGDEMFALNLTEQNARPKRVMKKLPEDKKICFDNRVVAVVY